MIATAPLPQFASVIEALMHWGPLDTAPLLREVAPPCDATGDEVADALLARVFYRLAQCNTMTDRLSLLSLAAQAFQAADRPGRSWSPTVTVVSRWSAELYDFCNTTLTPCEPRHAAQR